uniref:UPAR/Ly6 domain-containing protein n=1 Tax=Mus spicilegus TaxID=10103 RepID=A0A8C6MT72_MUSSI
MDSYTRLTREWKINYGLERLICNVCKKSQDSKCTKLQRRCFAEPGESCATISYFVGKHVFSKQECLPQCKETQYHRGDKSIYVMCCEKNLCNSF